MATSGSVDFASTRDDIITEAMEQLGVLAEGASANSNQLVSMSRTLNLMVKSWQNKGLNLFALKKIYLFLEYQDAEYTLGGASTDRMATSYITTTTTAASAAAATTIDVNDDDNISDGDVIGVVMDNSAKHWTTVDGTPSGDTVTLDDAIPSGRSVASGASVFAYTTAFTQRPMRMINVLHKTFEGERTDANDLGTEIEASNWIREQYVNNPIKTSDGQSLQVWYDPQSTAGTLRVWPRPNNGDDVMVLWIQRTLEDYDAATDDSDFPQEWFWALAINLAAYCAPKYGVPSRLANQIFALAERAMEDATSHDMDSGFFITPDIPNYDRY